MRVNRKYIQGFSILEVVVSVAIITIILSSIALLSTKSLQMAQLAQMRQKAVVYARQGIETIRNDRETTAWHEFINTKLPGYTSKDYPETGFTREVTYTAGDGTVEVTCTVTWSDSKGEHTVTQTTTLTRWI